MQRIRQGVMITFTLALCWLLLMPVHELGHVLNAVLSGGHVVRVIVDPLSFSRTDISPNPHPLFVTWGGPLWGCVIPLLGYVSARRWKGSKIFLIRFFSGFCLIANGVYIGTGPVIRAGDSADMLAYGTPAWAMVIFGVVTFGAGLYFWNGVGPHFGVGREDRRLDVSPGIVAALAALVFTLEFLLMR